MQSQKVVELGIIFHMQPYKIWKNEKIEKKLSKWHRKKNFGEKNPEKHEGRVNSSP